MSSSRREFLRDASLGVASLGLAATAAASPAPPAAQGDSAKLLVKDPDHPKPAPVGYDRLPLEWYKRTVARLKEKAGAQGVQVIVLEDAWNITYFTGNFMVKTERPVWVALPVDADAIFWWSPGLDIDLVRSWWCTEMDYYYDYHHADGGYPNQGKVVKGNTVDLFQWFLAGLKKRGFGEKVLGFDSELVPSKARKVQNALPQAKVADISPICIRMRMVKTPEEIALTQRAMNYFSQVHAFGRDYLLQHGTDLTDYKLGRVCEEYGIDLVMKDITLNGRPHNGVGIQIDMSWSHTGVATAYPHPNQFRHAKFKKGDALDIRGVMKIGGYGGECYRPCQLAPWDAHREKVWETVMESVRIQERESKAGVACCDVAFKVHSYQVSRGKDIQKLLYQRVGHGEGMEGHQPPYIALGNTEILEEGMTFSVEPGLFDPEHDFGYNPSDSCLVTKKKGVLQSSVPLTKEWMILKL